MTTSLALAALGMIAVVGVVMTGYEKRREEQDSSSSESSDDAPEESTPGDVLPEIPLAGDDFVSNDPTVSEEEEVGRPPRPLRQNKTHWCYATCAIILADGQYKPEVAAGLEAYLKEMEQVENRNYVEFPDGSMAESIPGNGVYANGMRESAVGYEPGYGYYCDPTQEYIATYYSYNTENEKQQYDVKCNNGNNDSFYTLCHITDRPVGTSHYAPDSWTIITEDGVEVLNEEFVKKHFLEPLKRGRAILDAYPKKEGGGYDNGHTYIAKTYDEASGLVTLYDPWTGRDYFFTLEELFVTGFRTPAFQSKKIAYGRKTIYFL